MNTLDLLANREITGVNLLPKDRLAFTDIPRINYGHCDLFHLRKLLQSFNKENLPVDIRILPRFSKYIWDDRWTVSDSVIIEDFYNINIIREKGYILELYPKKGVLNSLISWLLNHCVKGSNGAIEGSWKVPYITLIGVRKYKDFMPAKEILIPDETFIQSSFVPQRFKIKSNGVFARRQLLYLPFYKFINQI